MKKIQRWSKSLLIVFGMVLLTACGKKPPECADAAAGDSLHKFMNASIVEALPAKGVNAAEDSTGIIQKYLATWTFDLSNVTTKGYDEKSKTRSCGGKVTISIPDTKQTGYVDIEYDMQTFEDAKSGDFQLRASRNFKTWAYGSMEPVAKFYRNTRTAGAWSGISRCDRTEVRSETLGAVSNEEIGQGYSLVSTSGTWVADPAQDIPVELTVTAGAAEMKIAAGGRVLTRRTEVSDKGTFRFPSRDEYESLVPGQGSIADGEFVQDDVKSGNVGMYAKIKSNATGNLLNVVLVRSCVLKLSKK